MLKKLFVQFSELKEDQCIKLINSYDQNINKNHSINSKEIFIIGNLMLIIGWLIFNACAVMFTQYEYGKGFAEQFYNDIKHSPQHAVIVSILSSSFSVISAYLFYKQFPVDEEKSPSDKCITVVNASRAGLVMITGVCDNVSIYAACIIGAYAGIVYLKIRQVFIRNNIDDPMQSAQIHGLCGFLGVINTGLFG
jgi:ammonia channel protein AmtB